MFTNNRLKPYYRIIICISILTFSFCTSPTSPSTPINYIQGNTYFCGDLKMQLTLPTNWLITKDTVDNGSSYLLVGHKISSGANFNLLAGLYNATSNMNVMLDSAKIEIGSQFPGAITVTSQTVTIHNHIFGEYVVNVTMNGNALTMKQVYIFNNSNLIVFTFGDLNSNYPNSVLDFNTMENSIQFN
jgi:hypothetical protein